MSASTLFILSVNSVVVTKGANAGAKRIVAAIAAPTAIPGLSKIVGKAWYNAGDEPSELQVGRHVECGLEERDGAAFLSITRFVEAPTADVTAPALPF
jgi:hypothetical protein